MYLKYKNFDLMSSGYCYLKTTQLSGMHIEFGYIDGITPWTLRLTSHNIHPITLSVDSYESY